jgi:exodeoxyribonuclease VII large subunit
MTERDSPLPTGHNMAEFSVSELSLAIKRSLESGFERVRVKGEISGFKRAASGHLYLMLKDANAALKSVCWKGNAQRLGLSPEDGMEVVATGRITTYAERSEYQLVIERLELAGIGALLKLIEERKKKLEAEGLFDPARKRKIPTLPTVIGIVTSPTGAVLRDILHRLADRFPRHVLLWPVLVQGEDAAAQVAAAIRGFNALGPGGPVPRPDLLIVARGGGSIEDLMPFNEEIVVRAAAESAIPLISAVGHETDTTLIDFASDLRAPTPTAAAEMAVPVRTELLAGLGDLAQRLFGGINRFLSEAGLTLQGYSRGLPQPARLIEDKNQLLDQWVERWANARIAFFQRRLDHIARLKAELKTPAEQLAAAVSAVTLATSHLKSAFNLTLERRRGMLERIGAGLSPRLLGDLVQRKHLALENLARLLSSYSYDEVLKRGFALVRDAADQPILAAAAIRPGQDLRIQFHDGAIDAKADATGTKPAMRQMAKRKTDSGPQGSLL